MKIVNSLKMIVGACVVVVACSSAGKGGVVGVMAQSAGSGMVAAGAGGSVGQPMGGNDSTGNVASPLPVLKVNAQPIPGICDTLGADVTQQVSGGPVKNFYLYSVAQFPGKTAAELATHLVVTYDLPADGQVAGYSTVVIPAVKDGFAMIKCARRDIQPTGEVSEVGVLTNITFILSSEEIVPGT